MDACAQVDALHKMRLMVRAMQPLHAFGGGGDTKCGHNSVQRPRGRPACRFGGTRVSDRRRDRLNRNDHAIAQCAIDPRRERAASNNRAAQRWGCQHGHRNLASPGNRPARDHFVIPSNVDVDLGAIKLSLCAPVSVEVIWADSRRGHACSTFTGSWGRRLSIKTRGLEWNAFYCRYQSCFGPETAHAWRSQHWWSRSNRTVLGRGRPTAA